MKKIISIVAPMYNEEKLVHEYCEETLKIVRGLSDKYNFEIILVDDGSKDDTYKIMLKEQKVYPEEITVISLTRNFGLEGAVNAGIRKAIGSAVIIMDADLQDPPSLIPIMIEKWELGADIVVGSRVRRSNDSIFKKISANFYYEILNSLSGRIRLEKNAANFRLLSRRALDQVLALPEVNSVFRVIVPFVGMRTDIIQYDRDKRFAGTTKYNLKSMIPYALDSITGISVEPLRKLIFLLPVVFLLFIMSFVAAFIVPIAWRPAVVVAIVVFFCTGVLLLGLSIVAEYVAQIMIEVKGRPISVIYEYLPAGNVQKIMFNK